MLNKIEIDLWRAIYILEEPDPPIREVGRMLRSVMAQLQEYQGRNKHINKVAEQSEKLKMAQINQDIDKLQHRCAYYTRGTQCIYCSMSERCDAFDLINKIFDGADLERR